MIFEIRCYSGGYNSYLHSSEIDTNPLYFCSYHDLTLARLEYENFRNKFRESGIELKLIETKGKW